MADLMREVRACGICGSMDLVALLDMGAQPLAERLGDDRRWPLTLLQCADCSLVQLSHVVDQGEVFPLNHPYATGNTRALREHFGRLAFTLGASLRPGDVVADIGASDGTLLAAYGDAFQRVAVEPTDQAVKCMEQGISTWQEFFTCDTAERILDLHGPAKVIPACNVLAHVPDPHDFVAAVGRLLADDGVFVTENHDLASITEGVQIDTVYHEHLRYYSIASLSHLLAKHRLQVTGAEAIATHGGSFRVYARRQRQDLQLRAEVAANRLRALLAVVTAEGDAAVYGVGAATRATPLIHYACIAPFITCVCEVSSSAKIGHLMPGTQIPIVDEVSLIEDQPGYALLFSWHIAADLMPKLRAMGYQGKFIIPLPEPVLVDG